MTGKNKIKLITSLQQKKYRKKNNLFFVEGLKNTLELLQSDFRVSEILGTPHMLKQISTFYPEVKITETSPAEYKKISALKTPPEIMALCAIPTFEPDREAFTKNLNLVLDDITDPGNMGTIIRTAHWFGINNIICSSGCVDVFNPKVVQSAMGSITKVQIIYTELLSFLQEQKDNNLPVYGAFLNGKNLYQCNVSKKGFLVLGNESNGINKEVEKIVTQKVQIPQFTAHGDFMDSLNVSIACAVLCSEFSRGIYSK